MKRIIPPELGQMLHQKRQAADLSGAALGRVIGVSPPMIGHYERAKKLPTRDKFLKLVKALSISEEEARPFLPLIQMSELPPVAEMPLVNSAKSGLSLKEIQLIALFIAEDSNAPLLQALGQITDSGRHLTEKSVFHALKMNLHGNVALTTSQWKAIIIALEETPD